jgi:parvulin-like peptidyl-prolyl isomerase
MSTAILKSIPCQTLTKGDSQAMLSREWLVTNGLGGYASGTISGACTRRYHGLLIAALPAPLGRIVMFNHISEVLKLVDRSSVRLDAEELWDAQFDPTTASMTEFRLETGLPVWHYEIGPIHLEKRILLPHLQNTVYVSYRLLAAPVKMRLRLRPSFHFRPHESPVKDDVPPHYAVTAVREGFEVRSETAPALRMCTAAQHSSLVLDGGQNRNVRYRLEEARGYESRGSLWCPGYFRVDLEPGETATLIASTESWDVLRGVDAEAAWGAELQRRERLVAQAAPAAQLGTTADLVLAADQFIIRPTTRVSDAAMAHAEGDDVRTVIAGYHWFTDWGRDTMISLEGLTLVTGRHLEAGYILRSFARHVRDGLIPNLFPDGQFVGKDTYAAVLAQQNLTIPEFQSELSRQLLVTRLRSIVAEGVVVTPDAVEQEFRRRNEKAKVEYVKLTPEKFRSEIQPTADELRKYFEGNRARYQIPEKRDLAILLIDQAKLEQSLSPSDADLRRAYEQQKDRYRTPERIKVRHILLKTTGKSPQEETAIKSKAEDLLKQIRAGGDFAALAKKNSEDTGSAVNGGELPDWVTRGQTVPAFEKSAFSLKPKEISDLVKTEYGYHILQILDKQEPRLQAFDEAKDQLAAEWKKQRVGDQVQQVSDKAQAALQKDPQNPQKVASELNMEVIRANKVEPGATIAGIGTNNDFQNATASLKKGEVSPPVAVAGNKVVIATATEVFPAHPAAFEEVEQQVRDAVVNDRVQKLIEQRANELQKKVQSMGGDLKKAAQSMGLEVKASEAFTRQGAVEGLGSAAYVADAFTKPINSIIGPVSIPDGRAIAKVLEHVAPNMAELAAQRDSIREELKSRQSRERVSVFEEGLRQALIKDGVIKIHRDVLDRLTGSYRG